MRTQDFIAIYNKTFRYIANTYGRARINDLGSAILSWHLRRLVKGKGRMAA